MYTPDRIFVRDLKEIDQNLDCFFNQDLKNVVITYKMATGRPVAIYRVKNDDGTFRIPDKRDIDAIKKGDLSKEDIKTRLQKTAKYLKEYREKQEKDRIDDLSYLSRENRRSINKRFFRFLYGSGKANPFRRIIPRPKGKIYQ